MGTAVFSKNRFLDAFCDVVNQAALHIQGDLCDNLLELITSTETFRSHKRGNARNLSGQPVFVPEIRARPFGHGIERRELAHAGENDALYRDPSARPTFKMEDAFARWAASGAETGWCVLSRDKKQIVVLKMNQFVKLAVLLQVTPDQDFLLFR